jgi:hypothetical protein
MSSKVIEMERDMASLQSRNDALVQTNTPMKVQNYVITQVKKIQEAVDNACLAANQSRSI